MPEDGLNGGWIEATISHRHDRNSKHTVGSDIDPTDLPTPIH
jgi:hypothetical protein